MKDLILVTCAAGNVGKLVVQSLESQGKKVRAAVHKIEDSSRLKNIKTEVVAMDFDEPDSIIGVVKGVSQICLITPHSNHQVEWASRIIDQAVESGVKSIVRLSGLAVEFEPKVQVGRWMEAVENHLKQSGLEWTIIRPSPFMHNFFGLYPQQDGIYWPPIGDGRINHIHIQDVADILAEVIVHREHSGKILSITGGQALTMKQATSILAKSWQREVAYHPVSEAETRKRLYEAGKPPWLIEVLVELYGAFGSGATSRIVGTVEEILGRAPTSFEQFADSYRNGPVQH
ncbi:MAG: NmrA family NAD(P)-binding protein [Planctomycetota bacterium]